MNGKITSLIFVGLLILVIVFVVTVMLSVTVLPESKPAQIEHPAPVFPPAPLPKVGQKSAVILADARGPFLEVVKVVRSVGPGGARYEHVVNFGNGTTATLDQFGALMRSVRLKKSGEKK